MIIQPKIRGFICTTAHPKGCFQAVKEQIEYVKKQGSFKGPKNVLVIGASTGYGLESRIVSSFGAGANTIGVFFEKAPDEKKTASPGWYNTAAFETLANQSGCIAKSINGDAFSQSLKEATIQLIKKNFNDIDLIIYSLASPKRIHPKTGQVFSSTLKPIGKTYQGKSIDAFRGEIKEINIPPATEEEIDHTIRVMGGEDWAMWVDILKDAGVLAKGVKTVAYSYIGPSLTHPIYKDGTIGRAKDDLKRTANELNEKLKSLNGKAMISVNKAVVTQASAAIPVVPLYISILFKLMKEKGTHEGCIEQIVRLFKDYLYSNHPKPCDENGLIRLDDFEMDDVIQQNIAETWGQVTTENLNEMTDIDGYRKDFYRLFGFGFDDVDYETEADPVVMIPSLQQEEHL